MLRRSAALVSDIACISKKSVVTTLKPQDRNAQCPGPKWEISHPRFTALFLGTGRSHLNKQQTALTASSAGALPVTAGALFRKSASYLSLCLRCRGSRSWQHLCSEEFKAAPCALPHLRLDHNSQRRPVAQGGHVAEQNPLEHIEDAVGTQSVQPLSTRPEKMVPSISATQEANLNIAVCVFVLSEPTLFFWKRSWDFRNP